MLSVANPYAASLMPLCLLMNTYLIPTTNRAAPQKLPLLAFLSLSLIVRSIDSLLFRCQTILPIIRNIFLLAHVSCHRKITLPLREQEVVSEPTSERFLPLVSPAPCLLQSAQTPYPLTYNHKYMFVYPIKLWFHQEVRDYDHGQNRPSRFNDDGPQQNQQGGGGGGNQQRNSFGGGNNRNWMNNDRRNNDDFQSKRRRF